MNASPSLARTSLSIHRRTKRPICAISSKERTDRLHTGHTFKRVRETQWVRIAEKQILSTSADFKQQSDGRDYLGSKEAVLHATQQKGPKELLVIPFMFVFTGNPEHLFLFFYAKASKHGTLCRLMKLNSSEHNGQSFLSSVLELDVLALPQHWHKYIFFKCFKDEFAFNSWHIFHAKSLTIHVPFRETLFEDFSNWTLAPPVEHTHMCVGKKS